jgi:hypothetical protein
MKRFLLAMLLLSIQCVWAVEIRVPENWSQSEDSSAQVPHQMPPAIRPMLRLIPPTKVGGVSVHEMKPLLSLDEAAKTYVRGMPMRGIVVEATGDIVLDGHQGKSIQGHMNLAGADTVFPVEVRLFVTQESILGVEAVGKEAPTMINEVLSWIEFPPAVTPSKAPDRDGKAGRSFWEYLGIGAVLLALVYAVYDSKVSTKKRSEKGMK